MSGETEKKSRLKETVAVQTAAKNEMAVEKSAGLLKTLNDFLICHDMPSVMEL